MEILLAMVRNKYYAISNICPHMAEEKLVNGKLDGTVITCPRHASKFDLNDGHVIRWADWTAIKASSNRLFNSPQAIQTYPVKIEGETILIGI